MAADAGIEVECIRTRGIRKEARAQEPLAKRGEHPVLVCIFPALEPCSTCKPWHNKQSGKTYLVRSDGKCLHYYFYFADAELGFCPVRVPAWLPCRLQICRNGHTWLAGQLRKPGIEYRMAGNAFTHLGDGPKAQAISAGWAAKRMHDRLNELARLGCPIQRDFATGWHWSVNQCEYATDGVFRKQAELQAIYGKLTRTAIHTVKPDNSATFPGKKLSSQFAGEAGKRCNIRLEGTRIKHTMGPVALKLYGKAGLILRLETTVNEPAFFKPYREVEHRGGSRGVQWALRQKSIYRVPALRELLAASNRRYLAFLAAMEDPRAGRDRLDKLSQPVEPEGRRYSGFNLFDPEEENLLCSIVCGELNLSGLPDKTLRRQAPEFPSGQMSRVLKRVRTHGLIRKIGHPYKYYATSFGKQVVATALKLRELVILPQLAIGVAQ